MPGLSDFLDSMYQDPNNVKTVSNNIAKEKEYSTVDNLESESEKSPIEEDSDDSESLFLKKYIDSPTTKELFIEENLVAWKRNDDNFFASKSHSSNLKILDKLKNIHLISKRYSRVKN